MGSLAGHLAAESDRIEGELRKAAERHPIILGETAERLADVCESIEHVGGKLHNYGTDNHVSEKALRFCLGRLSEELDIRTRELRQLVDGLESAQRMAKDNKGS